ncbi:hypothetical protein RLIN73S_01662 [Rhodanobacter lindaniclasticus]
MEIPLDTVEAAVRLGHRLGVPVILDPAPPQQLPTDWLQLARYRRPRTSTNWRSCSAPTPAEDFRALMQRSPCPVVLTRGDDGAWYREQAEPIHQAGFAVEVVDGAGAPAIPSTPRSPCSCTKACRTPCARPAPPPRCR